MLFLILLAALLAGGWWYFSGRGGGGGDQTMGGTNGVPSETDGLDESAKYYDARRKSDLSMLKTALELYRVDHDTYPANLSMLESEYLKEIPKDPVTNADYLYERLGSDSFTLSATLSNGSSYTVTSD